MDEVVDSLKVGAMYLMASVSWTFGKLKSLFGIEEELKEEVPHISPIDLSALRDSDLKETLDKYDNAIDHFCGGFVEENSEGMDHYCGVVRAVQKEANSRGID